MPILLAIILLQSCSGLGPIRSGHFIVVQKGDTLDTLAKLYGSAPQEILTANQGREFRVGRPYFIPLQRGFARHWQDSPRPVASPPLGGGLLWPVPSSRRISSHYGGRWGQAHRGIDIPGRAGTAILAAADGRVLSSKRHIGGYGRVIILEHPGGLQTLYAHNRKNLVKEGQRVHRGQVIAEMGMSGRATGVHLHFEVKEGKKTQDPLAYISQRP